MKRFIVILVSLVFVIGCSALDNGDEDIVNGFETNPSMSELGITIQGDYVGTANLIEDTCLNLTEAMMIPNPLTLNVVNTDKVVSVVFPDEVEVSGDLVEAKTTIIKKNPKGIYIYHLEFVEDGIDGKCEFIDNPPEQDEAGLPCAIYELDLVRE